MVNIGAFLYDEFFGFVHFLLEKNVFQTGLAFVLATQINTVFLQFVNTIINPVIDKVIQEKTKNKTTLIFGIEFKTGQLSIAIINFLIVLLFLYYLYKISDSSKGIIENTINKIKTLF